MTLKKKRRKQFERQDPKNIFLTLEERNLGSRILFPWVVVAHWNAHVVIICVRSHHATIRINRPLPCFASSKEGHRMLGLGPLNG